MKLDKFVKSILKKIFIELSKKKKQSFNSKDLFLVIEKRLKSYKDSTIEGLWYQTTYGKDYKMDYIKKNYFKINKIEDEYEKLIKKFEYKKYSGELDKDMQIFYIINEVMNIIYKIISINDYKKYFKNQEMEPKKLYSPQTKRIKLDFDNDKILNIKKMQRTTIEQLNEYIRDEDESLNKLNNNDEKENNINKFEPGNFNNSIDKKNISFNKVQKDLLIIFLKNKYTISEKSLKEYSTKNNKFPNQLVNSINEIFYQYYEDSLIEEHENNYVINSYQISVLKQLIDK